MSTRRTPAPPADLDPLSQIELEYHLRSLDRECTQVITDIAELTTTCAEAEHKFKVSFAKSLLVSKQGSRELREAEALVANEQLNWNHKTAAARLQAAVEKGRLVRARIDNARSLNANVREAVAHPSGEGW